MKQAWPARYHAFIDKEKTILYPADDTPLSLSRDGACDWPASSFHLWKMCVTEAEMGEPRIEFRRIEWDGAGMGSLEAAGIAREG